jgi:hypothetical protein
MALRKTVTTVHGLEVKDAYHRVESILLQSKHQISFHVRSYVAPENSFFAEKVLFAPYALEGDNPIKQAYQFVTTLPEFVGAVDC